MYTCVRRSSILRHRLPSQSLLVSLTSCGLWYVVWRRVTLQATSIYQHYVAPVHTLGRWKISAKLCRKRRLVERFTQLLKCQSRCTFELNLTMLSAECRLMLLLLLLQVGLNIASDDNVERRSPELISINHSLLHQRVRAFHSLYGHFHSSFFRHGYGC